MFLILVFALGLEWRREQGIKECSVPAPIILAGPAMGNASLWVWMIICVCAVSVSPQIIDMDTGNTEGFSHDVVELRQSKQIFPRQTAGSNAQPFSRLRWSKDHFVSHETVLSQGGRASVSSILWPTTVTSKMPLVRLMYHIIHYKCIYRKLFRSCPGSLILGLWLAWTEKTKIFKTVK